MIATRAVAPIANLDRVSYRYPAVASLALDDVRWRVPEGAFVVVAGPSGSGKSTLLRCLNGLVPHFSGGELAGRIAVAGEDALVAGPARLSRAVGFVFQDPEAQLLTGRVDDELAFSLEQHGVPPVIMRKRVEEMLDLLGIAHLRDRDPATLSGGERQRVAVAAALALHPRLLVLDEPTSQLDPWGAEDVLTALTRLNEDLGLSIVLAEHRLERVLSHADQLRFIEPNGDVREGPPEAVAREIDPIVLPPVTQLGRALDWSPLPLTIKAGRPFARSLDLTDSPAPPTVEPVGEVAFDVRGLTLAHDTRTVLEAIDLPIHAGELVALMGRNGSGKTTLLRSLMGFHRPQSGRIMLFGRDVTGAEPAEIGRTVGYLPQQPGTILFAERLIDELRFTLKHRPQSRAGIVETLDRLGLTGLAERHPRDLSGGERERAALAAILVGSPRVLLLDEPTRGMDAWRKAALGELLKDLRREGVAVVLATHDVELVARYATRVVLLGDREIVADGPPAEVLAGSLTFSTQVNKLFGGAWLTVDQVLAAAHTVSF